MRQFSIKLLGLPTTKHFFSFILGCPQDLHFARPFRPFSPVSTQPYQNGRAKCKSCRHPRIKLKKCFVVGRPKSFIENCRKKSIHKTPSTMSQSHMYCHQYQRCFKVSGLYGTLSKAWYGTVTPDPKWVGIKQMFLESIYIIFLITY